MGSVAVPDTGRPVLATRRPRSEHAAERERRLQQLGLEVPLRVVREHRLDQLLLASLERVEEQALPLIVGYLRVLLAQVVIVDRRQLPFRVVPVVDPSPVTAADFA